VSTLSAIPVRLQNVPAFPPVAARLLGMVCGENFQIDEAADLISSDPVFAGRVLQYANSAEFGLEYPISNVRHALAALGLDRTRKITVNAATAAYAKAALRTSEMQRCWRHTVAVAVLSEEISRICGAFKESAYTAGLMHDVGRLALLAAYPAEYETTVRDCADRCLGLLDFERERFGFDHAEAGRILSQRWGLPIEFHVITGRHHDSNDEDTELSLLRIIRVACRLADFFDYHVTRPLQEPKFDQIVAELPPRARRFMRDNAEQLLGKIEAAIQNFDNAADADDAQRYIPKLAGEVEPVPEEVETVDNPPEAPPAMRFRFFPWFAAGFLSWLLGPRRRS
jgi:HD-like signal output (HDOD) protein